MQQEFPDQLRTAVRNRYGQIAAESDPGCGCAPSCCDDTSDMSQHMATAMGYSEEEIAAVPDGANLGLGCGNPAAIAALRAGETVVDLGAGAGFDCFLAAREVGESGRVIGIDMTPEMVAKARENADKVEVSNVEFRLGEIEHLPVADDVADVIISNCVINLSPEKQQVFGEAFRVLRPGGRLAVSDIVATAPLPESLLEDIEAYTGCVAGAELIEEVDSMLRKVGFIDVRITPKHARRELVAKWMPGSKLEDYVVSAMIEARKPNP